LRLDSLELKADGLEAVEDGESDAEDLVRAKRLEVPKNVAHEGRADDDGTFLALNAGASVRAFQSLEGDLILLDTDRAGLAELVRMEGVIDERVVTSRDAFMAVSSACRYGDDANHRS